MFDVIGAISSAISSGIESTRSTIMRAVKSLPKPQPQPQPLPLPKPKPKPKPLPKPKSKAIPKQASPTRKWIRRIRTQRTSTTRRRSLSSRSGSRSGSFSGSSFSLPVLPSLPSLPKPQLPNFTLPKPEIPKIEIPKITPPTFALPTLPTPRIEDPKELPSIKLPSIKLPEVKLKHQVRVPEVKLPEIKVDNRSIAEDVTDVVDKAKNTISTIVEKRDAIYQRGSTPQVVGAMVSDILLPLDLAKVLTKGAEKPEDYLWAGVDVVGLIPVFGWGAKGLIKGVAKSLKVGKALKVVEPLSKTAKVGVKSSKFVKGVEDLSFVKGFSRLVKSGEGLKLSKVGKEIKEIKEIKRISRFPKFKAPEIPKFRPVSKPIGRFRFRSMPKIPKFEMPKLKNPFSRMRPVKTFKVADEIPEVAKVTGRALEATKTSKVSKLMKVAPYAVLGGATTYALMNAQVPSQEEPESGDQEAHQRGEQVDQGVIDQLVNYIQDFMDWLASVLGMSGYAGAGVGAEAGAGYPYYEYPYNYYGGGRYPYSYEALPPEYGYEGYVPPAYVPEGFAEYVAPAEDFAQNVLGAVEGIPIIGDVAEMARRNGWALPFLAVSVVGAYAGYKYGYPKLKKLHKKGGKKK
jgi:hypothetical protein